MFQLPDDCLNEIFEHIEDDRFTLHSCLLVNRYWCDVSVRILWRNIWNYSISNFSTLIACLPNESKEILYNNGIIISTPTLKTPTFNYASFCKVLSVNRARYKIERLLVNQQIISPQSLKNCTLIVAQEIFQMFMKEIPSLRSLTFYSYPNMTFNPVYLIGAKDCLKNLTELCCDSDNSTELFHQLSQTCYNIQTLTIGFERIISSGIADLISVQRNLKWFIIRLCYDLTVDGLSIFSSLMSKIPNTLIKLDVYGDNHFSLSLIANLSNLQELKLSFDCDEYFVDFEKLQYVNFPHLQVLTIPDAYPKNGLLIKFLENNGKNLKEIYISETKGCDDNSLNLAIAKFCPNLKKISVGIKKLETLKIIFHSCKNLESIKIWCGWEFLSIKEALEAFAKYSQNTYELILFHEFTERFKLVPEELESAFMKWTDREPQKSFSLVVIKYDGISLDSDENIEIINKYIKLGVIKKFKATNFEDEDYYY
ncbi:uncharacterized protein OCT59_005009 [Rhizophagus irregularis]|uniref:F-box domain-containing protein n=3 Tax=Rhizophagus irregularis TaxID=588596 RepID=A0A015L6Y5_RHIIW|nr:hypothetical protein RirG_041820 [Rhizophagus irregularis DAOM 197198w]UZO13511.1 hypothetical protein OCT59_005009 [Rhizophagus irregularis]GBC21496.1 hypothetical protein GLOIN_2v1531016 [Rhizophagus irregularis DAOM 181602=DAOM 197198]